jgi:integrase
LACPDVEWKLIFALSRYGGLRCPSEHLALRWGDVGFERGKITVRSSKTEHHEGKGERVIPLFPELRPYLQDAYDAVVGEPDFDPKATPTSKLPVITRYRGTNANLRTQLLRIIAKAKLAAWPKLFQNLRASRATELAAEFPAHVAAEWMGHSTVVADKHYWRVTDSDFDRAICLAKSLQQPTETGEPNGNRRNAENKKSLSVLISRIVNRCRVGDAGLEPATSTL